MLPHGRHECDLTSLALAKVLRSKKALPEDAKEDYPTFWVNGDDDDVAARGCDDTFLAITCKHGSRRGGSAYRRLNRA